MSTGNKQAGAVKAEGRRGKGAGMLTKRRRKKGSGSLIKRGGRWVMRWRDGGRVVQEATPFVVGAAGAKEKAEALLAERSKIGQLQDRRDQIAVLLAEREEIEQKLKRLEAIAKGEDGEPLKLGGLVDAWKKSPRRKDCSAELMKDYEREIAAFVKWAGEGVRMDAVDDAMAEKYAGELGRRVSGNTYNKHLVTLTAAWRAVGRAAGVKVNPWADLPRKRKETHSRRALTKDEIEKILAIATGELRSLVLIGLRLGLRLGDACRLKWEAFDETGAVEVKTSKTGAVVRLPGARLLAELTGTARAQGPSPQAGKRSGYIVPGLLAEYNGKSKGVCKKVTALFEKAGIVTREKRAGWAQARATASFHSLRHTFVTRAIEAGVPVAMVRALVGHTSETMTEHYTHIGAAAILEAFSRVGD